MRSTLLVVVGIIVGIVIGFYLGQKQRPRTLIVDGGSSSSSAPNLSREQLAQPTGQPPIDFDIALPGV